jgi:hypothetical protein
MRSANLTGLRQSERHSAHGAAIPGIPPVHLSITQPWAAKRRNKNLRKVFHRRVYQDELRFREISKEQL